MVEINKMQHKLLKMQAASREHQKKMSTIDASRQLTIKCEQEAIRKVEIKKMIDILPERFRGKSFADFRVDYQDQAIVKQVAEFFVTTLTERLDEMATLKFLGHSGTGKTMLSLIMYQEAAKAGFTVWYEPSIDFLRTIQSKKFESNIAFQNALDFYKKSQFLVIDESSEGSGKKCYLTEWEQKLLLNIIDWRYQNKRCTLMISNRKNEAFADHLGEPIAGRMQENGATLAFTWKSYRLNQQD